MRKFIASIVCFVRMALAALLILCIGLGVAIFLANPPIGAVLLVLLIAAGCPLLDSLEAAQHRLDPPPPMPIPPPRWGDGHDWTPHPIPR